MMAYSNVDHQQASNISINDDAFDSQIMGPSDLLSLPSEPPDIRNWFSSYVYESPVLDTNDDFGGCVFKESEFQKKEGFGIEEIDREKREGFGIEEIDREKREGLVEFGTVEDKIEMDFGDKIVPNGSVKSSDSVGAKRIENQSVNKGTEWVKLEKERPVMNNLPFRKTFEQRVEGKSTDSTLNHKDLLIQDVETSSLDDEGFLGKLEKVSGKPGFMLSNINIYSSKNNRSSPRRLLHEENYVKESSEAKAQIEKVDIITAETKLDSVGVKGASLKKSPRKVNANENAGNNYSETGFISTRKNKSSRENDENSLQRPQQEKVESLRNVRTVSSACKRDNVVEKRRALSEKTNLQASGALEIAGKWRCPQRTKPNLGPPLKQLRLEQWVSRV